MPGEHRAETPSAARRLSCVQLSSLTGLCPAGGAKVAMCRTDESGAITTVELIDIDDDSVAAETELEGEWTVQQQSFCDKRIALCDREHNMWQLLSPDLADLGTVKVETCDGYFSYDAKSYYFLRDDVLCRTELESGKTQAVELDYDLRFLGYRRIRCFRQQDACAFLPFTLQQQVRLGDI